MFGRKRKLRWIWMVASSCCILVIFYNLITPNTNHALESVINPDFYNQTSELGNPRRQVTSVDCVKILEGNQNEIIMAEKYMSSHPVNLALEELLLKSWIRNCETFKHQRGYLSFPTSQEEKEFPVAFSILVYENIAQMERLLRSIYRPHNYYCVHVDKSASSPVRELVNDLVQCFENVFVVSKTEDVTYGGISRLKADINCMTDLITKDKLWKYFINLPSTEFPLKTQKEIIKILKIYNGANDIEGISEIDRTMPWRYQYRFIFKNGKMKKTNKRKDDPPHSLVITKGSAYGVFSRKFVEFVVTDKKASDLLTWMKDIYSPDEYYWATLQHSPKLKVPGGYSGVPDKKPWLAAFAIWGGGPVKCQGKFVHGVCVYGIKDLNYIISRKELFANKFLLGFQPLAFDCLEEWLLNRTFAKQTVFDTYYYRQLPFIH